MPPATRTLGPPRGVLLSPPAGGTFRHERAAPPVDLSPFVEHFWTVAWEGVREPVVREVLPHPSVHIVVERGRTAVSGVPRGRFTRVLEGSGVVLGIKFRPGGFRPFVGYPVSRLTGKVLPVAQVLGRGAGRLERAVLACRDFAGMSAAAMEFLRARLPARDERADEAAATAQIVLEDREVRRVEDLARRCGKSPRALQRLFGEYVGVSPKWVIRRYRLHEAIDRVNAGAVVDWAGLAVDLGYFDQAHFIRDFRALVGRTPAAYEREARRAG